MIKKLFCITYLRIRLHCQSYFHGVIEPSPFEGNVLQMQLKWEISCRHCKSNNGNILKQVFKNNNQAKKTNIVDKYLNFL